MAGLTTKQVIESTGQFRRNNLAKTVASGTIGGSSREDGWQRGQLHAPGGERKYLNRQERQRFLEAAAGLAPARSLFARLVAWTGARVSEVLALTPLSFQLESSIVTIVTLKRRGFSVREVPISPELMAGLDRHFRIRHAQQREAKACRRLWGWHRVTAWRLVTEIMTAAGIFGRSACPRGLRHAFGVATLQTGVPLNLIQRWMGHARLSSTLIYAAVSGPEELSFARQFWRGASFVTGSHATAQM